MREESNNEFYDLKFKPEVVKCSLDPKRQKKYKIWDCIKKYQFSLEE